MIQKPSKQNKTKSLGCIISNICDKRPVAVVQLLSHVQLFEIPWTSACQASLSLTISQSIIKLMSIELMIPSHPLLHLSPPPSIFPSIRVFSNELEKYWSFSISPSNECSGLISWRIDWFDLLAVQGTLKIFSTTVQKHQFFGAQPSGPTFTSIHDYWKNHSFDYMDLCQQSDRSAF